MLLQQYYDVPDQLLILNHALMVFGLLNDKRTALLLADIDEFLMLNVSRHTVFMWREGRG